MSGEQGKTREELADELQRMTQAYAAAALELAAVEDFLRPAVTFTHLARMEGREPAIAYAAIGRELVERFAAEPWTKRGEKAPWEVPDAR